MSKFLLLLCFLSCHADDYPLEALAQRFQSHLEATHSSDHHKIKVLSQLKHHLDSLDLYQQLLGAIDPNLLSPSGREQHIVFQRQLKQERDRWEPYRSNPAHYNLGGLLKKEMVQSYANETARQQSLLDLLDQTEQYYSLARRNLEVRDFKLFRLAAQKQYAGLNFLTGELQDSLASFSLDARNKALINSRIRQVQFAMKDYLAYCESQFLNARDSTHYVFRDNFLQKSDDPKEL